MAGNYKGSEDPPCNFSGLQIQRSLKRKSCLFKMLSFPHLVEEMSSLPAKAAVKHLQLQQYLCDCVPKRFVIVYLKEHIVFPSLNNWIIIENSRENIQYHLLIILQSTWEAALHTNCEKLKSNSAGFHPKQNVYPTEPLDVSAWRITSEETSISKDVIHSLNWWSLKRNSSRANFQIMETPICWFIHHNMLDNFW